MRNSPLLLLAATLATAIAGAAAQPTIPEADRVRLAEAFQLSRTIGDSLWPGWHTVPFPVLLITADQEFLIGHPRPGTAFTRVGHDSLLGSEVLVRARTFPPTMLATFPAVGGVPTIVVGTAELSGKRSTAWVLTVLHERFHQLQYGQPGYYPGVAALDLARGDETGMWMLNYAFPYDSAEVRARFGAFARALGRAVAGDSASLQVAEVLATRDRLRAILPPADYRYLAFQLWQEGVSRYVELRAAELAARHHAPTAAFRALPDFTGYAANAAALRRGIVTEVDGADLAQSRREIFYATGAALALLLDRATPDWRLRYFTPGFTLDPLFR